MLLHFFAVSCVWIACLLDSSHSLDITPNQVHLSYGGSPDRMYVTWSTMNQTGNATCYYGQTNSEMEAKGITTKFTDGGAEHHTQYIHRVLLTKLISGQRYVYQCGNGQVFSKMYKFTALKAGSDGPLRMAVFGDMGSENAQSLPRLLTDIQNDMYDAVLHVGDFAYDMDSDNGKNGDLFMQRIEPIAAALPYMTCPGNHEEKYNFSNYRNRFTMPGDELGDRMYYSFDVGPVHVISISTEYLFYVNYGIHQIINQYEWLKNDLEEANKAENRAKRPWIITMGHRPMYCSNDDNDDCTHIESLVRVGVPFIHFLNMEKLMYENGVDLMIWAHEHSYERLWPVFNRVVHNGSLAQPYTNPKAPVHVITGSAGCKENHDGFQNKTAYWSAFRSDDYGYSRMTVYNSSHLYLEQVSDDKDGKIIDSFTLIKDSHGPYDKPK